MDNDSSPKKTLRRKMCGILADLSQQDINRASDHICQHIRASEVLFPDHNHDHHTLAVYSAHGPEISLARLHESMPAQHFVYPLCHPDRQLSFHHVERPSDLSPGMHGILEPNPEHHPEIDIKVVDVFLCPGLAFGKDGSRLGHGGGYYDRVLENFSGIICGIAMDIQIQKTVPHAEHDVPMDFLITETGLLSTKPH